MAVLIVGEWVRAENAPAPALGHGLRSLIGAARQLDPVCDLLLFGGPDEALLAQATALPGVRTVLVVDDPEGNGIRAERLAPVVAELAGGYRHVMVAANGFGKQLLPRVAGLRDQAMISDVVQILGEDTFVRPMYAGNVLATVRSHDPCALLSIRISAFKPLDGTGSAESRRLAVTTGAGRTPEQVAHERSDDRRPALDRARVVVAGGRGLGSADAFRTLIEPLADRLGGAVGASRAAVDGGYIGNDHQVGQTGKVVAPALYLAVGISGAAQHLAGMSDAGVVVAINPDPEAPIHQHADISWFAPCETALPALLEALVERQS